MFSVVGKSGTKAPAAADLTPCWSGGPWSSTSPGTSTHSLQSCPQTSIHQLMNTCLTDHFSWLRRRFPRPLLMFASQSLKLNWRDAPPWQQSPSGLSCLGSGLHLNPLEESLRQSQTTALAGYPKRAFECDHVLSRITIPASASSGLSSSTSLTHSRWTCQHVSPWLGSVCSYARPCPFSSWVAVQSLAELVA